MKPEATKKSPAAPKAEMANRYWGLLQHRMRCGHLDTCIYCCQLVLPVAIMLVVLLIDKLSGGKSGNLDEVEALR